MTPEFYLLLFVVGLLFYIATLLTVEYLAEPKEAEDGEHCKTCCFLYMEERGEPEKTEVPK